MIVKTDMKNITPKNDSIIFSPRISNTAHDQNKNHLSTSTEYYLLYVGNNSQN